MKSERGFTLLELIMVMVVMGIISSSLVLPFLAGLKQATRPEIYATATYLAQEEIEKKRGEGYSTTSGNLGTSSSDVEKKGRTYTETVLTEYVEHDSVNEEFDTSVSSTEFIKVTVTVSNSDINVELWTILAKDFY
jgi:prepilin-type N-terminal cleavage/methylation domain-containing protein